MVPFQTFLASGTELIGYTLVYGLIVSAFSLLFTYLLVRSPAPTVGLGVRTGPPLHLLVHPK